MIREKAWWLCEYLTDQLGTDLVELGLVEYFVLYILTLDHGLGIVHYVNFVLGFAFPPNQAIGIPPTRKASHLHLHESYTGVSKLTRSTFRSSRTLVTGTLLAVCPSLSLRFGSRAS